MLETRFNLGLCRDHEFYLCYDTFINGQANGVSKCPVSDISLLSNLFLALRDVKQDKCFLKELEVLQNNLENVIYLGL